MHIFIYMLPLHPYIYNTPYPYPYQAIPPPAVFPDSPFPSTTHDS